MNERIENLMIQAGLACDGVDSFDSEALNNFVKSLVKNIIEEVEKTPNHHCHTTWDVGFSDGTKQAVMKHLRKVFE